MAVRPSVLWTIGMSLVLYCHVFKKPTQIWRRRDLRINDMRTHVSHVMMVTVDKSLLTSDPGDNYQRMFPASWFLSGFDSLGISKNFMPTPT